MGGYIDDLKVIQPQFVSSIEDFIADIRNGKVLVTTFQGRNTVDLDVEKTMTTGIKTYKQGIFSSVTIDFIRMEVLK